MAQFRCTRSLRYEWLDVVEFRLDDASAAPAGIMVNCRCFASGVIPTIVPLAPLLSIALFWITFGAGQADVSNTLSKRITMVKEQLQAAHGMDFGTLDGAAQEVKLLQAAAPKLVTLTQVTPV